MGQPVQGDAWTPAAQCIGRPGGSRGTETSQYPDDKKSSEIPLVVASERGAAQTGGSLIRRGCRTDHERAAQAGPKGLEGTTPPGERPAREPATAAGR